MDCEGCKQDRSSEKEQSLHHEDQVLESTNKDVTTQDQSYLNTEEGSHKRSLRRSGTLNELESGTRHVRLDSPVRKYVTQTQHTSSRSSAGELEKTKTYTLSQAFFIVAGGLAIETKSFRKEPYLTVTPAGAVELARLGLLSPVEQEVINDKTKADPITKAIVCVQAAWFIVQCIARAAQHLPLTLLEIHTLAHVFIAMLMYLFWFPKPYNALSPFIITDPQVVQTAALFTLSNPRIREKSKSKSNRCVLREDFDFPSIRSAFSEIPREAPSKVSRSSLHAKGLGTESALDRQIKDAHDLPDENQQGSEQVLTPHADENGTLSADLNKSSVYHRDESNASPTSQSNFNSGFEEIIVTSCSPASEQEIKSPEPNPGAQPQLAYRNLNAHNSILEQQPKKYVSSNVYTSSGIYDYRLDITLALAQHGVQRLRAAKTHFTYFQPPKQPIQHRSTYLVPVIADFSETPGCRLSNSVGQSKDRSSLSSFGHDFLPSGIDSVWVLVLFVSYGAFHLIAWESHFPTPTERWMWRGAGLIIVGDLALALFLKLNKALYKVFNLHSGDKFTQPWAMILYSLALMLYLIIPTVCFFLLSIATAGSRLYFLVEAVISLRAPAPRIYETVEWTQFWPHI